MKVTTPEMILMGLDCKRPEPQEHGGGHHARKGERQRVVHRMSEDVKRHQIHSSLEEIAIQLVREADACGGALMATLTK